MIGVLGSQRSVNAQDYRFVKDVPVYQPWGVFSHPNGHAVIASSNTKTVTYIDKLGSNVFNGLTPQLLGGPLSSIVNDEIGVQLADGSWSLTTIDFAPIRSLGNGFQSVSLIGGGRYVSSLGANLRLHDAAGNVLKSLTVPNLKDQPNSPQIYNVTCTPNGEFVLSVHSPSQILLVNSDFVITKRVGTFDYNSQMSGTALGSFNSPMGTVMLPDKCIVVCDYGNERVQILDFNGNYKGHFSLDPSPLPSTNQSGAFGVADVQGTLFVTQYLANKVSLWVETTKPTTNFSILPTPNVEGWNNTPVTVNLLGTDNYGVSKLSYQYNGDQVEVQGNKASIQHSSVGETVINYSATDINENVEPTKTITVKIDTTPPTTTYSLVGNRLSISSQDDLSGTSAIYYFIDGKGIQKYQGPIDLDNPNQSVYYWGIDNADNEEVPKKVGNSQASVSISSFSTSPQSSVGGRTISSTITLSTAQSIPTTINLGSDNASVVVPASVTIDAGQTSKTFTIETKPVGAYTQTNITATLGTQTRTAQLDLLPPTVRIRISPPVVSSESTAKATITLSGNAPTGGLVVELESDESAASVPSSITVPEGQKTATFNITAGKVTEETYAYITATIDGVSSEASLTIRPKSIKPTTLSITESLVGGAIGTGTITLSDPAPEGGLDVDLATNNAAVSLPLLVKVAEGSKTANFSFSTSAVSNTITATVSAKANGATVTDTIEVKVRPLGTLVASPSTLPGKATGTLTLTLSSPTSTPLTVNVSSSNAAVVLASKTITIPKGQSSGILKFTTTLVGTDTTSTITCLSNGLEAKTDITVRSAKPSNVSLLPAVVLGGKGSVGTVTIDSAAPTSGLTVALSSSDSSAVVPSFVLVPSGKTSATFTITTSKVTSSKNVTITASANGVSKTATLGVRILTIASISFNPVSVEGGVKANALLTLTDVAPLGGMTVTLGSDKAGVTVPSTVLVPAGKSSVAFVATTSVTGSSYDARVTGTANGETGSGTLKVLAPTVSSFALSSTSVKGGDKPLGTVKIAKASTVDVVVNLSSSNAAIASLPASITIPKGQLLATFQVTTTKPSAATSVTLSATTGGLAKTVVLKVSP